MTTLELKCKILKKAFNKQFNKFTKGTYKVVNPEGLKYYLIPKKGHYIISKKAKGSVPSGLIVISEGLKSRFSTDGAYQFEEYVGDCAIFLKKE